MKDRAFRKEYWWLILIMIVQIAVSGYYCAQKAGFHMDEFFTYALANNEDGKKGYHIEDGVIYDGSIIDAYTEVEEGHTFDYRMVYKNQVHDVHPPVYYAFIHTINSIVGTGFQPWVGWGFNIAVSLIVTVLVFYILKYYLKEKIIVLVTTAAIAILPGMIESISLIRMYELAMMWYCFLALLHIHYYNRAKDKRFYISLYVISTLGVLTHYYILIFMFFLCLFFGVHLLRERDYKGTVWYCVTMGASGGSVYLLFPAIIHHLLGTRRGNEAVDNATNISKFKVRIQMFYDYLNDSLFAHLLLILIVAIIVILIVNRKKLKSWKVSYGSLGMLCFSCGLYWIVISQITTFKQARYIYPIYPIVVIIIAVFLITAIQHSKLDKRVYSSITVTAVVAVTIIGHLTYDFPILYREEADKIAVSEEHSDSLCLVIYEDSKYIYRILPSFPEIDCYDQKMFLTAEEAEHLSDYGLDHYDNLVVYVAKSLDEETELTLVTNQLSGIEGVVDTLIDTKYVKAFYME